MSYTPDDQYLEGPISQILTGFERFESAAKQRLAYSEEWNNDHLDELGDFLIEIRSLEIKLRKLRRETR